MDDSFLRRRRMLESLRLDDSFLGLLFLERWLNGLRVWLSPFLLIGGLFCLDSDRSLLM